jgi:hypothetical protein
MDKSDIIGANIFGFMVEEAREWQKFLDSKNQGYKTVDVDKDKNIKGYLGHWIVEAKFNQLRLPIISTRKIKYTRGDLIDIEYEGQKIDVKTIGRTLDENYFFNIDCGIFQHQINEPKFDLIDYFVFTMVSPDFENGWILGVIHRQDFLEKSFETNLKYKGRAVKSNKLRPFMNYIYRV